MAIDLIYCAAGNARFAEIAMRHGFRYGARLPATVYYPPYFADQDWRKPDRARYMAALEQHRPTIATVLDYERPDQRADVLGWAEDAARWAAVVVIIPKWSGAVADLPRRIGGAEVRLGYSVPTAYGGTPVPAWEFTGWPVHLLGGQPHDQMRLARYLDVRSVDGNYAQRMALQFGQFWSPRAVRHARNRWWPKLREAGILTETDVPYAAFEWSCQGIRAAWSNQA